MIFYQDVFNRSYFREYDESTNPNGYDGTSGNTQRDREHALLKRAIDYVEANNLVSDTIDLDVNDDGDIDSITFMVSGEDNGWNTLFWPHKWDLSLYYNNSAREYYSDAPMINGKYAYTYTFELLGNSTSYAVKVDVGVLSHETFHLISAPDLYHYYRYGNIEPVGDWGLMDGTTTISSHMLGYMKEVYGNWIQTVDEITESGTYTLAPMADSADNLYKIDLGYSNEFVYLEYRVQDGLYESNLPGSGLLVYRVDYDYFDDGNVQGYYDASGEPRDELFIFRPGINTDVLPIIFPEINNVEIDEDGDIDNAAISNNNPFSEMGNDTDIAMFYSDGTLMDIKIYNVIEHDGLITFDIYLPPTIELVSELDIPAGTDLYLYDGAGFSYRVDITNIPSNGLVYYTLDGTEPSTSSTLYTGGNIGFDASSNIINFAIYVDGVLMSIIVKEYNFVNDIETAHNPYGNMQNIIWYLDLEDNTSNYDLHFYSGSFLEDTYDYLRIISSTGTLEYTGSELSNLDLSYDKDILIQFETDYSEDNFYGFHVEVDLLVDVQVNIIGEEAYDIEVFSEYTELGAELTGGDAPGYTLEIIGTVDTSTLGQYIITYNVLDPSLTIIKSDTRTVSIVDTTAPEIIINGEQTINVNVYDDYIDQGVIYSDNLDTTLDYDCVNPVDTNYLGRYEIEYTVTDLSGNVTTVVRVVNVVDTTAPEIIINGEQTINVNVYDDYIDQGVIYSDNLDTTLDYDCVNPVDTNYLGRYEIEYTVTDLSGNVTTVVRVVNVVDTTAPTASLIPGVDTIYVGETHLDESINVLDNYSVSLTITTNSNVDTTVAGTYTIEYTVIDGEGNVATIIRYVNVIEKETENKVVFELGKTVNTVKIGDEFTPASCSLGGELADDTHTCNVDLTEVDTNVAGTYRVLYYVEIDSVTYTKRSYVFVYNPNNTIVWYYDKSRRGYL